MEIDLEFLNIKERARKPKATIQRSGKLGFNSEAIEVMKIKAEEKLRVATNKNPEDKDNLYLVKCIETPEDQCADAIRVSKAGEYFYLNLTSYFDDQHLDYENKLYIYNIYVKEYKGMDVYQLKRRDIKDRGKNPKDQEKKEE